MKTSLLFQFRSSSWTHTVYQFTAKSLLLRQCRFMSTVLNHRAVWSVAVVVPAAFRKEVAGRHVGVVKRFMATERQTPRRETKQVAKRGPDAGQGEVTIGRKVVQAGKDASYMGIVVVGIGVTAIMFYAIGRELFASSSPNAVYTKAYKLCKNNSEIIEELGEPIKGFGETTRRGRRRHVSHLEYEQDGVKHMRMKFYIQGPKRRGTVHLEVKQGETGRYEYRYLFAEMEGYPHRTIILEDNR